MKAKKLTAIAAAAVLMAAPQMSLAQDSLNVRVTASAVSMPNYLGDDENQLRIIPDVKVTFGDRFEASLDGIRYTLRPEEALSFGPVAYYHFGRGEDPTQNLGTVSGGDTTDLNGLGDIAGTWEVGAFAKFKRDAWSGKVELRKGVAGGHNGLYGEAKFDYTGDTKAGPFLIFYSLGPKVTFGDAAYNSTFFDVSAGQSAASGLSQYDAGAGVISAGLQATVVVPFSEQTYVGLFGTFDQLMGEVANSSLVQERGAVAQTSYGFFFSHGF